MSSRPGKRILIVDDDAAIRRTLGELLEEEGYAVASAANGREALACLRDDPSFALVLLDLMMPVMDGFQFRAEQKSDPALASLPVVVMTARGGMDRAGLDAEAVVSKPFDLLLLMGAIERSCRSD
ncbi:chemotaxis protein CheY [Sorangium cellulosum]|uniref:Chemotaxis protein CheY n=1 Tax=Sorangium cellulosum TaxID=56 RepID=A0A2L0EQM8_SORCE|nr:response regulator [Sorangium cellulosum]AUX41618.1 chemotaxis protein CheY [Sorangium cellulosum]